MTIPLSPQAGWPLLRLGFRPFYLLAACAGVLMVPLWLLMRDGVLAPSSGLAPVLWHAHEMLFGMVAAVVVGFLFTAGRTWTGLQTPRGAYLGFFVLLWIAARVASVLAPYSLFFWLDVIFLPLSAAVFAQLLLDAGNHRNLGIAVLLALLGGANLLFHLGASGALNLAPLVALHAGLALLVLLQTVIAGRVIPQFTRNAIAGLDTQVPRWREQLLVPMTGAGLALWLLGPAAPAAVLLGAAAVLHGWRLLNWQPRATRGRPMLWVLHLAYAWIPLGLALLAWALAQGQAQSPAIHALAVGASAGLMLAMMARTARGHTGRPIQASVAEVWAFRLILAAAAVRVAVPLLLPGVYAQGLVLAGTLFALAFLIYLCVFASWLAAPRVDGLDG